jgi:hypothetical protein
MSKTDELGASRLALSEPSIAEKLQAAQTQAEIQNVMRGVIQHRDNVHCVSTSILPERPTPPAPQPPASRNGWSDLVPLSPPPGIREIDAMCIAHDAADRANRKGPQ